MLHVGLDWILYLIMSIVDCYLALLLGETFGESGGPRYLNLDVAASEKKAYAHTVALSQTSWLT